MRVEIRLSASMPELLAEMEAVPPRARPERLRFLAQLGVMLLSGKVAPELTLVDVVGKQAPASPLQSSSPASSPLPASPSPSSSPKHAAKQRAMARIGASFQSDSDPENTQKG